MPLWQRLPDWRFEPRQQIASGFDGAISFAVNMASRATLEVCESMCEMLPNTEVLKEVKAHRFVHDKLNGGKL